MAIRRSVAFSNYMTGAHLAPGTAEVHVGVRERRIAMGLPNNTRRRLAYVYRTHATSPLNDSY